MRRNRKTHRREETNGAPVAAGHYPPARTAPWFFLALAAVTVAVILAGVFRFEPLARVVHWLAVVL